MLNSIVSTRSRSLACPVPHAAQDDAAPQSRTTAEAAMRSRHLGGIRRTVEGKIPYVVRLCAPGFEHLVSVVDDLTEQKRYQKPLSAMSISNCRHA